MPSLFNGYCYPSIEMAGNAEISLPVQSDANGLTASVQFTPTGVDAGYMLFNYTRLSDGASLQFSLHRHYPVCANVGYLTNYSGLTLADAIETAWGVVAVWCAAWCIKKMRGR